MDLSLRTMTDKDLIKQLKELQNIKPSQHRAISAREDLINHIDGSIAEHGYTTGTNRNPFSSFAFHFSRATIWATAGTFAILLGVTSGVFMSQDSIPGSTLYPVKIASEDVQGLIAKDKASYNANRASERLEETSKLASTKLSEEDAAYVAEKLTAYKENIETAKTSENKEDLEEATHDAEESSEALTSLISNPTETKEFKVKVGERLAGCQEEKLAEEATELLDQGGLPALIEAHFLSIKCEKIVEEPTDKPMIDEGDGAISEEEDPDKPVSSE